MQAAGLRRLTEFDAKQRPLVRDVMTVAQPLAQGGERLHLLRRIAFAPVMFVDGVGGHFSLDALLAARVDNGAQHAVSSDQLVPGAFDACPVQVGEVDLEVAVTTGAAIAVAAMASGQVGGLNRREAEGLAIVRRGRGRCLAGYQGQDFCFGQFESLAVLGGEDARRRAKVQLALFGP